MPCARLETQGVGLTPWQRTLKRCFDVVLAILVLALTSPVLFLAALVIRLDSRGPVVYRQQRIGERQVPFTLFKLRTMIENADQSEQRLIQFEDGMLRFGKCESDPRLTHVGAEGSFFIRASSTACARCDSIRAIYVGR